jgi:acylphosphatase
MKEIAIIEEKDLSLVSNNILNKSQLSLLLQKTPAQYVRKRPAKGGGEWEYVTAGYVKKILNLMFGWDWDFEILSEIINIEARQVIVKGKLTCRSNGMTIVKMQYGRQDLKFRKGTLEPLDLGNDMKGAASDCLKKCASELGVAADIYNKEEFREVKVVADGTKEEARSLAHIERMNSYEDLWDTIPEEILEKYPKVKKAYNDKIASYVKN